MVVVYEHVTAGGLRDPSPGLREEGLAMADALLRDLREDGRCAIRLVRDARLPVAIPGADVLATTSACEAEAALDRACKGAALAWLIAPETDGALAALTQRVVSNGTPVAGASADAIAVAASKRQTAAVLASAGLPVVATYRPGTLPDRRDWRGEWVVKPDDGAGCESTWVAHSWAAALECIATRQISRPILQPRVEGEPLSLSCLATRTGAVALCVNRQRVVRKGDALHFEGVDVGIDAGAAWDTGAMASDVARALPGLRGYFGIDLLQHPSEGAVILEVNPRLTTAYSDLRNALGVNVASRVLDDFDLFVPANAAASDLVRPDPGKPALTL